MVRYLTLVLFTPRSLSLSGNVVFMAAVLLQPAALNHLLPLLPSPPSLLPQNLPCRIPPVLVQVLGAQARKPLEHLSATASLKQPKEAILHLSASTPLKQPKEAILPKVFVRPKTQRVKSTWSCCRRPAPAVATLLFFLAPTGPEKAPLRKRCAARRATSMCHSVSAIEAEP